jgi:hypothetical protein
MENQIVLDSKWLDLCNKHALVQFFIDMKKNIDLTL